MHGSHNPGNAEDVEDEQPTGILPRPELALMEIQEDGGS